MNDKYVYKKVLFSSIIFFSFFIILEIISKIILYLYPVPNKYHSPEITEGLIVSDTRLNHKWRPHLSLRFKSRDHYSDLITNQEGWLEKTETLKEKPENVYRIFYVGDSTTQGVVTYNKSMVNILEKKLNNHYKSRPIIEIINTGTSSYSTLLYYLLIRHKILEYSPDLIVINIDMTDIPNDMLYRKRLVTDKHRLPIAVQPFELKDKKYYRMTPEGVIELSLLNKLDRFFYEHLSFYRLFDSFLLNIFEISPEYKLRPGWLPWHAKLNSSANWLSKEWNPSIESNVEFSMEVLRNIINLLNQQNVKIMVTGVPHYPQYTGKWSYRPHEVLKEVCMKKNVPYLNSYESLKNAIKGTRVDQYYWKNDPTHFNEKGNKIWAEAQYSFLLKNKGILIP